jgi:hypothetical protein
MKRTGLAWLCGFAAVTMFLGARASAQTMPPATAGLCSPACAPDQVCVSGQCMVPAPSPDSLAAPPPPPPPVAPAPSPPVAAPPPAPETVETPPPPPVHRKPPRPRPERRPVIEEEESDEPAAWRRGVLVMPSFGFHAVEGLAADDYDAGARIGLLMGSHATPTVSLNVELAMDFLSPKQPTIPVSRTSLSGHDFTAAFSPLFHASNGIGEFVVGPKLGFWSSSITSEGPTVDTIQASQTGWIYGFNLGGFAGVTDSAALGVIVAYQMTYLSQSCTRDSVSENCDTHSAPQILSFNVAALF